MSILGGLALSPVRDPPSVALAVNGLLILLIVGIVIHTTWRKP